MDAHFALCAYNPKMNDLKPRQRIMSATSGFVDAARHYGPFYLGLGIFVVGTFLTYAAQSYDRPISAALIYVSAVTIIGAVNGLKGGLAAGISASFFYNFFFSEPLLDFGVTTSDEYIPLVAFNLSALLSGTLAGRVNDRARAAEEAKQKIKSLLEVSNELQKAVRLENIDKSIEMSEIFIPSDAFEIYAINGKQFLWVEGKDKWRDKAINVVTSGVTKTGEIENAHRIMSSSGHVIGVLIGSLDSQRTKDLNKIDVVAFLTLLNMAIERFVLSHQKSEADALQKSEELKTALLSSISHDMRTPLSAISASASSLLSYGENLSDDTRRDMLTIIQDQCQRLNRYTTNLLNMGRLQSGISEDQFENLDLVEILGSAINLIKSHYPDREFIKSLPFDSVTIAANPVMLEQLFYNIMENAVQYSPVCEPVLITGHSGGLTVEISISDQGEGIAATELERIFERFYRSNGNKRKEGHGLGLSIAAGFANAFGGQISAKSPLDMGKGSRFTVTFPKPQFRDRK